MASLMSPFVIYEVFHSYMFTQELRSFTTIKLSNSDQIDVIKYLRLSLFMIRFMAHDM